MCDNQHKFSTSDFALGHLLIDCAANEPVDAGDPVSPEELAVFSENNASRFIDANRKREILKQLSSDPQLYADWLDLSELQHAEEFTSANVSTNSGIDLASDPPADRRAIGSEIFSWLASLLTPQYGFVALLSAVLALVVYHSLQPDFSVERELVIHDEQALQEKASKATVGEKTAEPFSQQSFDQWIRCLDAREIKALSLCYSHTTEKQHWFIQYTSGVVKAIDPLVAADEILNISHVENKFLVEFNQSGGFHLRVLKIDAIAQQQPLEKQLLYQDAAVDGYFDNVQLDSTGLRYTVVKAGKDPEIKQYEFQDESK